MTKKSAERIVGPCVLCGRYFYSSHKTRPPKYCWECAEYARRENNKRRQQAWRDRQKEGAQPAARGKGGRGRGSERERGGLSSPSLRAPDKSPVSPVGLWSGVSGQIGDDMRRRFGLPALAR